MTKARNLSDLLDATGDVVSTSLDNVPPSDNASLLTTGTLPDARLSNQVKVVKSANAPSSPQEGNLWYDTTNELLKVYNNTDGAFIKITPIFPSLSSISGDIFNSTATNLTLTGTGFLTANLVVSFTPSGGSTSTVTVTPTNDTTATVAVPSAIYGQSATTVITIKATNSDNQESGTINKTVIALPSGGTISNSDGYRIHTFTSSGTFTNTISNLSVEYLVIAGGGAGGGGYGGGGGAGGYRNSVSGETSGANSSAESALTLSTGNKTVTVGGGAPSTSAGYGQSTVNGYNSVFDSITSLGGGGGGNSTNGASGGSGGGAMDDNNSGGAGTSGQGFAGGSAKGAPNYGSGGGGGASAVGVNGTSSAGGNGGNGLASSITGSSVIRAGGGGGATYNNSSVGSGGTGGGGNANNGSNGVAGTANTGGGGGGSGSGGSYNTRGGNGGSGIVIVRYQI